MTEVQSKFVELEKRKEEVKQFFKDLDAATQAVADEIGIDSYFQDGEGTVYKVVIPKGTFTEFKTIGYLRTKRYGEKAGSLSVKEAQEKGFEVP